jgi:hypothetical protein
MNHIDKITVTQVQSCAESAVIDLADIERMSRDTLEAFARDTTECVTLAQAQVSALQSKAAIDQLGFAVNAVGPIALLARAGFLQEQLRTTLINTNKSVITKLTPSCVANPMTGDTEPGADLMVVLRSIVYDNVSGIDWVTIPAYRPGDPLPDFDFTRAKQRAVFTTSYPLAEEALARL